MFEMPAFVDGHAHPLFAGRESLGPKVDGLSSISQIQAVVADYADSHPEVEWIVGGAYDRSLSPSFLSSWLDEVVSDRPVVLHASDHHTIWVNSKALELAGLSESAPPVSIGSIDVDDLGRPSGTLRESGAMELVLNIIPALPMEHELAALDWAHEQMLSHGISAVQDAWIERGMTEIYLEALQQNILRVRTNLAFRITPENWESDFEYFFEMRRRVQAANSPLLTAKTVKFFADGVLGSGTAAVLEPYDDFGHNGEPVWDYTVMRSAAALYADNGFQLHIHAIGDAGVRAALDTIEAVQPEIGPSVIAHTELVNENDIKRFAELNVIANFEPLWARKDGMLTSCIPHIGERRIDQMYRMQTFVNSGATISFGSDWPVSSVAPLLGIQTAVTRAVPGEPGWTLEESLSVEEAIEAYTRNSKNQILDDFEGIETVVLTSNPVDAPLSDIYQIEVIEVKRDGLTLWKKTK